LSALIEQASSDNLELSMAPARVAQADARARQAGAANFPSVEAGANGNYLAGHSVNGSAPERFVPILPSALLNRFVLPALAQRFVPPAQS
jgi:outer membrane protein TolC